MENKYIISENELLTLLRNAEILSCLEGGGVDNWDGYDMSLGYMEGEELIAEDLEEMYPQYKGN